MATVGTLDWAEGKVDELFHQYVRYLSKAYTLQLDVGEVAGRENLKDLSYQLDEALSIIKNHESPFGKTDIQMHAEALKEDLDRVLSGLS